MSARERETGEYLLEVRTEDIPARMLEPAMRHLGTRVFEDLMGLGLGPRELASGATPRRLVLILKGLPAGEADRDEQTVGPPARVAYDGDGNPTKALEGFAKRCGVPVAQLEEQLERIETDKGEYVAVTQRVEGRSMAQVLAELVPQILADIPWPKTMRWTDPRGGAQLQGPWVRPVHGVVSLLDGEVVPFELFGIAAGRETLGHPVLSPEPFEVSGVDDYRSRLEGLGIEISPTRRRERLAAELTRRAEQGGGRLVPDEDLLTKLTALCAIPGVLEGSFPEAYLELPREVLITSLKDHQSAFTVERVSGEPAGESRLLPRFLTVMDRPDDPAGRVRSGNEWVVDARLADARFFYGEDRKRSLEERAGELEHLSFHVDLGSYAAKAARLEALGRAIGEALDLDGGDLEAIRHAARLLKVDLTTEMVKEFTSLQGVMGGIYGREDGLPEPVWQGIYDQYLPAGTEDPIPRGPVGQIVALADRLDTLVGIFGLGLVPTGSRDPFGLRRAAQGVVRIVLEAGLPLDLSALSREAAEGYGDALSRSADQLLEDLEPFLLDRVRHLLGLAGHAYDEIEAGLPKAGALPADLPDLARRVAALQEARSGAHFLSLVLAAKRIANITKEEASGEGAPPAVDPDLFADAAEHDLHREWRAAQARVETAAARADDGSGGNYGDALAVIAELAPVLDRFFDEVLVMAEDDAVRANRLALLSGIGRTVSRVGRLSEMVVDRDEHRRRHGGGEGEDGGSGGGSGDGEG